MLTVTLPRAVFVLCQAAHWNSHYYIKIHFQTQLGNNEKTDIVIYLCMQGGYIVR